MDWAGRNVAESKTALAANAVELTYGPELDANRMPIPGRSDHPRAKVLTYSDVQKFMKYLKYLGYPARYFCVGEYGSERGRSHWHLMVYWLKKVPTYELRLNFSDRHRNELGKLYPEHDVCKAWPHGFMYWDECSFKSIMYNMKYIQKDIGVAERQGHVGMSKFPPLGAEFFKQRAEAYVAQRLAPQAAFKHVEPGDRAQGRVPLAYHYSWPEVKHTYSGKKQIVQFKLREGSASHRDFLSHYVHAWQRAYPGERMPNSDLVTEFLDPGSVKVRSDTLRPFNMPPDRRGPVTEEQRRQALRRVRHVHDYGEYSEQQFHSDAVRRAIDGKKKQRGRS